MSMMWVGLSGMLTHVVLCLWVEIKAWHWMVFAAWAIITVCGAIRGAR